MQKPETPPYEPPPWAPDRTLEWLETRLNVQTLQFMVECIPTIQEQIAPLPRDQPIRALDVGTGSGVGANLLATLHSSDFLGHRIAVDAMELATDFEKYAKRSFPLIRYVVGDVWDVQAKEMWDIILCSHVLEHIDDGVAFVRHLQSLAREWVLFYTPWKERQRIEGHVTSIDEEFLEAVSPFLVKTIDSPAWRHPVDRESKCVLFVVSGSKPSYEWQR